MARTCYRKVVVSAPCSGVLGVVDGRDECRELGGDNPCDGEQVRMRLAWTYFRGQNTDAAGCRDERHRYGPCIRRRVAGQRLCLHRTEGEGRDVVTVDLQ